jgi:hypothetical protein
MRNVRGQRPDPPRGRTDPPTGADQYAVWYWRWYLRGAGGRVLRQDGLRWAWHAYSDGRRAPLRSADQRWTRYKKFNQELAAVYPDSRVWATEQGVVLHAGTLLEAGRSAAIRNDGMRAFVRGENSFVELPRVARFY